MTGWTLGQVKASFLDLEAHCENDGCRHFYAFDLDPLIEEVGADFALRATGVPQRFVKHAFAP